MQVQVQEAQVQVPEQQQRHSTVAAQSHLE
jgi:hypothetical protein